MRRTRIRVYQVPGVLRGGLDAPLIAPRALKAATKVPSSRRNVMISGSDSPR